MFWKIRSLNLIRSKVKQILLLGSLELCQLYGICCVFIQSNFSSIPLKNMQREELLQRGNAHFVPEYCAKKHTNITERKVF